MYKSSKTMVTLAHITCKKTLFDLDNENTITSTIVFEPHEFPSGTFLGRFVNPLRRFR